MPRPLKKPAPRNALRHILVWLLAGLLPLQGMAAGVITVIGPAHIHKSMIDASLVLSDFRRAGTPPIAPHATHVTTAFGHFHGADTPLRHHHPRSDASVVHIGDAGLQQGAEADESSISPTLAAFVALLPSAARWLAPVLPHALASPAAWPSLTHDPEPLERPPRAL